jgi:hypothetical protein
MRLATIGSVAALIVWPALFVGACNGDVLDLGGDAGRDGASNDGPRTADGASSSSSDSGGSLDSGAGTSSGGGGDTDAGDVVLGNIFPCGTNVCTPPNVCCETLGSPILTCEAASACQAIAIGCSMTSCPSGALCCGSVSGFGGATGSGQCQVGTTCSAGTGLFCTPNAIPPDCPNADYCAPQDGSETINLCLPRATAPG